MKKVHGLLVGAMILLSSCSSSEQNLPPPPKALLGQVHQLNTAGIKIILQGDRLRMIIPTDLYFEPGTATVNEDRQTNLRQMATFVKNFAKDYPNSVIHVIGHTDQVLNLKGQLDLSQNYATAVSAYIFNAGIEPKRIATEGRGGKEPIADPTNPRGATQNRRVVVQVN